MGNAGLEKMDQQDFPTRSVKNTKNISAAP